MASEWFYTINGQQAPAPATAAQLRQMANTGQLQPTDLVWQEGMANWAPASSIKGLFSTRGGGLDSAMNEQAAASNRDKSKRPVVREHAEEEQTSEGMLAMHPVLVLLLTAVTLGLFGLIYAYVACSAYREQFTRDKDAAGRPLGYARHPVGVLILTYVTLGIYHYFWVYRVLDECRAFTGRKETNPRTEVALMLIFPPYGLYVTIFRLPELIRAAQALAKVPESNAVNFSFVFLNPCLLPFYPLLTMLEQESLNQVWLQSP